ncbi:MAG: TIR domain-containing protein [Planctomycetaceae bacterium]|nr:TIR domain-containing protein [Planctomycetaceae bacterium]
MAILVTCPSCGRHFRAKDQFKGIQVKCPKCRQMLSVEGPRVRDHDVFISHSNKDKAVADAVCADLEAKGIRCWIAPRDISAGMNWGAAIVEAIGESRAMVLVFSSAANVSQQVLREVERAVAKGVSIFPLRIEDVAMSKDMEYFLSASHWLDAMTTPLEEHLDKLASAVRLLLLSQEMGDKDPQSRQPRRISFRALIALWLGQIQPKFAVFWAAVGLAAVLLLLGVTWLFSSRSIQKTRDQEVVVVPTPPRAKTVPAAVPKTPPPRATVLRPASSPAKPPAPQQPVIQSVPSPEVSIPEEPAQPMPPLEPLPQLVHVEPQFSTDAKVQSELADDRKNALEDVPRRDLASALQTFKEGLGMSSAQMVPQEPDRYGGRRYPLGSSGMPTRGSGYSPGGYGNSAGESGTNPGGSGYSSKKSTVKSPETVSKPRLPEKLVLTGILNDFQVKNGSTWMEMVVPSYGSESPMGGTQEIMLMRAQGVLIVFDGADIADAMADYKKGERVSVLVKREDWRQSDSWGDGRVPTGVSAENICQIRFFLSSDQGMRGAAFGAWCLRGIGVEKTLKPQTWANAQTGKMRKLINSEALTLSPSWMLHHPLTTSGVRWQTTAVFQSVSSGEINARGETLAAGISIKKELEQTGETLALMGSIGRSTLLREFLDYAPGDKIEVGGALTGGTAITQGGGQGMPPSVAVVLHHGMDRQGRVTEGYPITSRNTTLVMNCDWVRKAGNDSTRVMATGPRRKSTVPSVITPAAGAMLGQLVKGKEVTWTGRLRQVLCDEQAGETHLLIQTEDGVTFEAFTRSAGFLDELDDFSCNPVTVRSRTTRRRSAVPVAGPAGVAPGGDSVSLKGTLVDDGKVSFRLAKDAPLLEVLDVRRCDREQSRAVVGQKRDRSTLDPASTLFPLAKLQRRITKSGATFPLEAEFSSFTDYGHKANFTIKTPDDKTEFFEVAFPSASKEDFSDYKSQDVVTMTVETSRSDNGQIILRGRTIQRRGNTLSLITDTGRRCPPRNYSADEKTWKAAEQDRTGEIETVALAGRYEGAGEGVADPVLKLKHVFGGYSSVSIKCPNPPDDLLSFLNTLRAGDELLLEAKMAGKSYSRTYELVWVAREDEPAKRVAATR